MRILVAVITVAAGCSAGAPVQPPSPPEAKRPIPGDSVDEVSAVSAAGLEHTQGLDWDGPTAAAPAKTIFKNTQVLGDVTADRFMLAMQSFSYSLGIDCTHCHEEAFAADTKPPKPTARTMLKMARAIDTKYFGAKTFVTCYTCHRQEPTPPPFVATRPAPTWPMPPLDAAVADRPAKEVYKNLSMLGAVPARRVADVMLMFSSALGVGCVHCHLPDDWSSDAKPRKQRARDMLAMVRDLGATYFPDENPIHCATCHRGSTHPARNAGPLVTVTAALAGGAAAPWANVLLGPPTFTPKTRGDVRTVLMEKKDKIIIQRFHQTTRGELGHVAPGAYSVCGITLLADPDPNKDPKGWERTASCVPFVVGPEPDVQGVALELAAPE